MTARGLLTSLGVAAFAGCLAANVQPQPEPTPDPGPIPSETEAPPEQASDSGEPDAGAQAPDGGEDAGFDAGFTLLPTTPGWQFFGRQHGLPAQVLGVSSDQAGNVWVAGGDDGLFLLTPGATHFQRFTHADGLSGYTDATGTHGYRVLSVRGGPPHTVFVGYKGLHAGMDEGDPAYMVKSGDADRVVLDGAGIAVTHFDISTPPGVSSSYPQGRDKIRDVFRIAYDPASGDVWFGGNHGIALFDGRRGALVEHEHADINGYLGQDCTSATTDSCHYTLLSGDYRGVGLDPRGDFWFGGGHRLGRLAYGSEGRKWSATLERIDVWPDAVPKNAYPDERTDDFVEDLAILRDGTVWVGSIANGLARLTPAGVLYVKSGLIDDKVTALEADPKDDSLWVGHIWGGITRIQGTQLIQLRWSTLGPLTGGEIWDIQSDELSGQRRILVAFARGAVGIYSGE